LAKLCEFRCFYFANYFTVSLLSRRLVLRNAICLTIDGSGLIILTIHWVSILKFEIPGYFGVVLLFILLMTIYFFSLSFMGRILESNREKLLEEMD